jgi:hypothetical protein
MMPMTDMTHVRLWERKLQQSLRMRRVYRANRWPGSYSMNRKWILNCIKQIRAYKEPKW